MVEFQIQAYTDRERIVMGLVNSGYRVQIVERPDPIRYLGKLYFVQVEEPTQDFSHIKNDSAKAIIEKITTQKSVK